MNLRLRSDFKVLLTKVSLLELMPPARSCTKCKSATAAEGDSWCTGCTSWEFIGRELGGSWDSAGARLLANDLVVTTARQIRALRSLSAGLARQGAGEPRAGTGRAPGGPREPSQPPPARESLPRRRSSVPPPPLADPKEEDQSEEVEVEEESEEEERSPTPVRRGSGHQPPPEPDNHPSGRRDSRREADRSGGGDRDRHRHREPDSDRSKRRRHSGGRRGGRKHQRLARLALDPNLVVHRKPGSDFWDLRSGQRGALEDDRLGH